MYIWLNLKTIKFYFKKNSHQFLATTKLFSGQKILIAVKHHQGDQIGQYFCQLGYLGCSLWLSENISSPKYGNVWAAFCLSNFLHVTWIISFKVWLVVEILRFQNRFDADVFDFQIELRLRYFASFGLATFMASFSKINWDKHPHYIITWLRIHNTLFYT